MPLRCQNKDCDSEFFTPDEGQTIFNSEGEIVSYVLNEDREPWISEVLDEGIVVEWISVIGDEEEEGTEVEEEEFIPLEEIVCLQCESAVELIP